MHRHDASVCIDILMASEDAVGVALQRENQLSTICVTECVTVQLAAVPSPWTIEQFYTNLSGTYMTGVADLCLLVPQICVSGVERVVFRRREAWF